MSDNSKSQADTKTATKEAPAASTEPQAAAQPVATTDPANINLIAAIGYLGILFLVPLLTHPKNSYAIFHANQGLLLFITAVAINIVGGLIPIIGWFLIVPLGNILILVFAIMGFVNALNGKTKRLPAIGGFDLIKVQP